MQTICLTKPYHLSFYNNVVAFNGRPRCDIFKCHANCCMNAPIPESYLSKYSDKIVNPVIKTVEIGNIPSQGGKQIIPITTLFNLLKNKCISSITLIEMVSLIFFCKVRLLFEF